MPTGSLKALIVSATALLACAGCSTGHDYWRGRLDDAKDIGSFTVGLGFGVKARVGPLQVDSGYNYSPVYGLRGGELLPGRMRHGRDYHVEEGNIGVPWFFCNMEIFYPGRHAADRGKAYCALTPLLPVFVLSPDEHSTAYCNSCSWHRKRARFRAAKEKYEKLPPEERKKYPYKHVKLTEEETKALRDKLDAENPKNLPFDGRRAWYKYADIEVTAALFGGFSIGINPGEFLDLLAGFVGLDLFRDDI